MLQSTSKKQAKLRFIYAITKLLKLKGLAEDKITGANSLQK